MSGDLAEGTEAPSSISGRKSYVALGPDCKAIGTPGDRIEILQYRSIGTIAAAAVVQKSACLTSVSVIRIGWCLWRSATMSQEMSKPGFAAGHRVLR
jgi:hypothetical protein